MNRSTTSKMTPKRQSNTKQQAKTLKKQKLTKQKKISQHSISTTSKTGSLPISPSLSSTPQFQSFGTESSFAQSAQSAQSAFQSNPLSHTPSKRSFFTKSRALLSNEAKKTAYGEEKGQQEVGVAPPKPTTTAAPAVGAAPNQPTSTHTTTDSTSTEAEQTDSNGNPLPKKGKVAQMYEKYGKLFVFSYFGVYFATLGALSVTLNVIPGFDASQVFAMMEEGGHLTAQISWFRQTLDTYPAIGAPIRAYPKQFANFGAAWCITKVTEPARLVAALAVAKVVHSKREAAKQIEQQQQDQ